MIKKVCIREARKRKTCRSWPRFSSSSRVCAKVEAIGVTSGGEYKNRTGGCVLCGCLVCVCVMEGEEGGKEPLRRKLLRLFFFTGRRCNPFLSFFLKGLPFSSSYSFAFT